MNEPDQSQKNYVKAAAQNAKPRRCRCGATAQPSRAYGLMWGSGANALSTSVDYRCAVCGCEFRVGLLGDAIGYRIVTAILARIGLESLLGGLLFVPIALILTVKAVNKIRLRLRHPVVKTSPA